MMLLLSMRIFLLLLPLLLLRPVLLRILLLFVPLLLSLQGYQLLSPLLSQLLSQFLFVCCHPSPATTGFLKVKDT